MSQIMTTAEIRQLESGALAFGQKTYGNDLADAMYLGTFTENVGAASHSFSLRFVNYSGGMSFICYLFRTFALVITLPVFAHPARAAWSCKTNYKKLYKRIHASAPLHIRF